MSHLSFEQLLQQEKFSRDDLAKMLTADEENTLKLLARAEEVRLTNVSRNVYLRGLIEISNICSKDCYYCGIRKSNKNTYRYELSSDEILSAAEFAYKNRFGSIVLQGGEITSSRYTEWISTLLKEIKNLSNGELGITLSLGEQSKETYEEWFRLGAHRYLLRIESSDSCLYSSIHPHNNLHSYRNRLHSLGLLKEVGYQVGTGVMIGLPGQTVDQLAGDLLFIKSHDIDMVGMGPYIEHKDTPLYSRRDELAPIEERYLLGLKMVACLRILMSDINIAAVTALQAIKPEGREMAIKAGANVIMPNITPGIWRNVYKLYENKPTISQNDEENLAQLISRITAVGYNVQLDSWGDSLHFKGRK
ncbi:MAG: [FeFe] hydrogenase H-cluster radical SAM maturase HydE [Prevotellaceae bacterium]|jgi:biotin synthase|nr:[FeFe] hydrogenase H-cluster radical SAM maturase HydE [Prevotellaceae bacterium]